MNMMDQISEWLFRTQGGGTPGINQAAQTQVLNPMGDMSGMMDPTAAERRRALSNALMQAGAGMLANNVGHFGAFGPAAGAGLSAGLSGYQQGLEAGPNRRLKQMDYQDKALQRAINMQNAQTQMMRVKQEQKEEDAMKDEGRFLLTSMGLNPDNLESDIQGSIVPASASSIPATAFKKGPIDTGSTEPLYMQTDLTYSPADLPKPKIEAVLDELGYTPGKKDYFYSFAKANPKKAAEKLWAEVDAHTRAQWKGKAAARDVLAKERAIQDEIDRKTPLGNRIAAEKMKPLSNTTVNIAQKTEGKYGEAFATGLAKEDNEMRATALKAPELASRANQTLRLLASGNAITGFGADFRLNFAKALHLAGVSDGESATDTEQLASDLANNTLDFVKASGLGSGNGFTDKDREFLEKAKGGSIKLEAATLERLATLAHRAAEQSTLKWQKRKSGIPQEVLYGTGLQNETYSLPAIYNKKTPAQLPRKPDPQVDELLKKYK